MGDLAFNEFLDARYKNYFLTFGKHSMTCFLMGEDIRSVLSCVDSRFGQNPSIKRMECDLEMSQLGLL